MKIIDGHVHACGLCLDDEGIKRYIKTNNVERVVLCAGEPHSSINYRYPMLSHFFKGEGIAYSFNKWIKKLTKVRQMSSFLESENQKVLEIARKLPEQVIATYWVNPLEDDCMDKLNYYYEQHPFRLIKLHQCWTTFDLDDPKVIEILTWARVHHCPIFIHLYSQEQVQKFINLANQFHDIKFITAHLIGARMMMKYLKSKRVYFDLSAPQLYSKETLQQVLDHFGAARLILGSDTPYGMNNLEHVVARLRGVSVAEEELKYICGKNLARVLALN